jgi:hypothetical protein
VDNSRRRYDIATLLGGLGESPFVCIFRQGVYGRMASTALFWEVVLLLLFSMLADGARYKSSCERGWEVGFLARSWREMGRDNM